MIKIRVSDTSRTPSYWNRRIWGLLALSLLAIPLMGAQGGCGESNYSTQSDAGNTEQADRDARNEQKYRDNEEARLAAERDRQQSQIEAAEARRAAEQEAQKAKMDALQAQHGF